MSSYSRKVPYRTLAVHKAPPQAHAAAPERAAPRFAQLLRGRRASGTPASENGLAEEDTDAPQAALAAWQYGGAMPDEQAGAGSERQPRGDDSGGADQDEAQEPEAGAPWMQQLLPTPQTLAALLAPCRNAAARRRDALPASVRAVARTIADFCNQGAASGSGAWRVRLPLRQDVLPETTLDLLLSPPSLQLRFSAADQQSRRLLYDHQQALRELLEEALAERHELVIAID